MRRQRPSCSGTAFSPEVHSGPPRGKLNDAVSFLWRWELAGHPRDTEAWRIMHDFANQRVSAGRCGIFRHAHRARSRSWRGMARRWRRARGRSTHSRVRAVILPAPCVPAVSRAFTAFEQRDFSAAIDALEPIADELERIGGSHAQLDLVRFTLLRAYLGAERLDDARRILSKRRPHGSAVPVVGSVAAH